MAAVAAAAVPAIRTGMIGGRRRAADPDFSRGRLTAFRRGRKDGLRRGLANEFAAMTRVRGCRDRSKHRDQQCAESRRRNDVAQEEHAPPVYQNGTKEETGVAFVVSAKIKTMIGTAI